jgi:hypothetical protein
MNSPGRQKCDASQKCDVSNAANAQQSPVLHISVALGHQDFGAALAFLPRPDKADHVIDRHCVAVLIQSPDCDTFPAHLHECMNAALQQSAHACGEIAHFFGGAARRWSPRRYTAGAPPGYLAG